MKKTAILMAIALSISLFAACSDNTPVQKVDTPPSESSKAESVSSSEPAPEPTTNSAGVGETLERGGIQFTFEKVENYVDESDYAMDKAEDGNEFVLLWFAVRNTSNEDYHVNMFYEDSYLDGFSIEPEALLFSVKGDALWGDLAAGKAKRGYVGFQVPENWEEIEFQYKPIFSGQESKLIFIAKKSDLS